MKAERAMAGRDPWEALLRDDAQAWDDAPTLVDLRPGGALIAVRGVVGGVGSTLVASGIALASAVAGRAVALVELSGVSGNLADGWGIPADRTLDDLAGVLDELAPHHLELVCYPHQSGVYLLLAPDAPVGLGIWDDAATSLLLSCARALGDVVVDFGTAAGEHVSAASEAADHLVVVAPPTLRGARRARAMCGSIAGGSSRRVTIVANRGIGRDHLRASTFRSAVNGLTVIDVPRADREAEVVERGRWPTPRRRGLTAVLAQVADQVTVE